MIACWLWLWADDRRGAGEHLSAPQPDPQRCLLILAWGCASTPRAVRRWRHLIPNLYHGDGSLLGAAAQLLNRQPSTVAPTRCACSAVSAVLPSLQALDFSLSLHIYSEFSLLNGQHGEGEKAHSCTVVAIAGAPAGLQLH